MEGRHYGLGICHSSHPKSCHGCPFCSYRRKPWKVKPKRTVSLEPLWHIQVQAPLIWDSYDWVNHTKEKVILVLPTSPPHCFITRGFWDMSRNVLSKRVEVVAMLGWKARCPWNGGRAKQRKQWHRHSRRWTPTQSRKMIFPLSWILTS